MQSNTSFYPRTSVWKGVRHKNKIVAQGIDVMIAESIGCCEYTEKRHQIKLRESEKAFVFLRRIF